jgi:DNA primase
MGIFEQEIDITKYIELYDLGISIKNIKPVKNQTYKILMLSNSDIRVVDREKVYKKLLTLEKMKHFTIDTKDFSNRYFYMIPLQTPKGTIVGFVLRSVYGKTYNTICRTSNTVDHKVPYMYGFYKDFERIDNHKNCMPIVICEGLKDCIVMKKIYPYVLANNTSQLGINASILRNISNKFILVYDNDDTGIPATKSDKEMLRSMGCYVDSVQIENDLVNNIEYKDVSDLLSDPLRFKKFKRELVKKINYLIKN